MADLNKQIIFDKSELALIKSKLEDEAFTFQNWGDEDLQNLRSAIRKFYREEQKAICAYCQNVVSIQASGNCHVEHIAPKSIYHDFIFEPKNLCVICADCNTIKRQQETINTVIDTIVNGKNRKQYPRTTGAFKIVHPHFDIYSEHILIFADKFYVDITEKGHFTIGACWLNRRISEFGWESLIIDETQLIDLMTMFLAEKDSVKRSTILGRFKKLLLQV